jgi:hypothetical protein
MYDKKQDSRSPLNILLPLGVLVVVMIVLSACGGQANTADNPATPVENGSNDADTSEEQPAPTDAASEPAPTEEMVEPEPTEEMTDESSGTSVSFSADVFPILDSRCINCHGGDRIEGELIMRSYDDLMAGGESGQVIVPGDAANSILVKLVTDKKMPKRGPKLTPIQVQTITDWVNQGAQNN